MQHAASGGGDLTAQIEALRQHLAAMKLEDMPLDRAQAMGEEIAALRANLKRLEADRARIEAEVKRALE